MSYNEQSFLTSIRSSYIKYKIHGARSSEKLKPLHLFAANTLRGIWGNNAEFHYLGEGVSEFTVEGKYYPKDIDVTVKLQDKPVFCLGIKFVTSNYKQNANNYYENMMGETANIQANNIPYAQLIILRYETPYYKKNNPDTPSKIEVISEKDLNKYLNLMNEPIQAVHRPKMLGIHLVNINEDSQVVESTDIKQVYGKAFAQKIEDAMSVRKMFDQIKTYKQELTSKKV